MLALFVVIGLTLATVLVVGVVAWRRQTWLPSAVENPAGYWLPWAGAFVLWAAGLYLFWNERAWFYGNAHKWSAIVMFVFIVLAIVFIGLDKWRGDARVDQEPDRPWALAYWGLAGVMGVGVAVILALAQWVFTGDFRDHQTFAVEAWMIFWLATFWSLQTWDRRAEGAPPRTAAELAAR
jgi:hypothetical protein